jgi:hypothetical protein
MIFHLRVDHVSKTLVWNTGVKIGYLFQNAFDVLPRKALVVHDTRPLIVVVSWANCPSTEVDCSATAQPLASRVINLLTC